MCCFLICIGNISPLSLVSSDSPNQEESRETGSGEGNMLHQLAEPPDVEVENSTEGWEPVVGSMTEKAVRLLAEERERLGFWN